MLSRKASAEKTFFSEAQPTTTGFLATDGSIVFKNEARLRQRKINRKEHAKLIQLYNNLKHENVSLRLEKEVLESQVLDLKTQYLALQSDYKIVQERFESIKDREEWGKIVRNRDGELQRNKEVIKKLQHDRDFALSRTTQAQKEIVDLKYKLKKKEDQIQSIRLVEKIHSKAKILSETERLRTELNEARYKLKLQERLLEDYKRKILNVTKTSKGRTFVTGAVETISKQEKTGRRSQKIVSKFK